MTFAEKIQQLRKEKGLSQDQLALELGVSRQSVSKWELGDSMPDINKVLQLADYFQVSTDYLLRDEIPFHAAVSTYDTFPINTDYTVHSDFHDSKDEASQPDFDQTPQRHHPFDKAFKVCLGLTLTAFSFPFILGILIRLLHQNGGRLGTTEFLFMFITVTVYITVPLALLTLLFFILRHFKK